MARNLFSKIFTFCTIYGNNICANVKNNSCKSFTKKFGESTLRFKSYTQNLKVGCTEIIKATY